MAYKIDFSGGTLNSNLMYTSPQGYVVTLSKADVNHAADAPMDVVTRNDYLLGPGTYSARDIIITFPTAIWIDSLDIFGWYLTTRTDEFGIYNVYYQTTTGGAWTQVGSTYSSKTAPSTSPALVVSNDDRRLIQANVGKTCTGIKVNCSDPLVSSGGTGSIFGLNVYTGSKYLVRQQDGIKTYAAGNWQTISAGQTPTASMFTNNGMAAPLTTSAVAALPYAAFELLTYIDNSHVPVARETAVPFSKVVLPQGDIGLAGIDALNSITLSKAESGAGKIRVAVSIDQGSAWKIWNGVVWTPIDISDKSAFSQSGMTAEILNTITKTNWMSLINGADGLRFAYYFEYAASTDVANTDLLVMNVDMKGVWRKGRVGTEYDADIINATAANVSIYINGSFKINY